MIFLLISLEASIFDITESYQVNATIMNCTFQNNLASQSGLVFRSSYMRVNRNYLQLLNNTFLNNVCNDNGGLFSFVSVSYNISTRNNIYMNNQAKRSGGVGYIYKSEFLYLEDNGFYYSNNLSDFILSK